MEILRKMYLFFMDAIQSILIAASVFLVIYIFIARPFQVNGESMVPNFQNGEYVLTNLLELKLKKPRLGDVVVFQAPIDPEKDFIKRIIGVPGDTVMLKDGNVYVNGNMLDESAYLSPTVKTYAGSFLKENEPIIVPQDQYFVMGDNRTYSSDSREWGYVTINKLIGYSFFVYWPPNRARFVGNPFPAKK